MTDHDPPTATLTWIAETLGTSGAYPVRRLAGGTHAATHLVRTSRPDRLVVLRTFPAGDHAVRRETAILGLLDGLNGLAPRLLAADHDGDRLGSPTILVTRLPGTADIMPADPYPWAAQLGGALARIHATPVGAGHGLRDAMPAAHTRVADHGGPAAGPVLAAWHRLADAPPVLTHNDYWSGNTIWTGTRLTGIVDWSGALLAPRGFDVAWCRLDLVLLYDEAVADAFTAAYAEAAEPVPDLPLWDLFAAASAHRDVETWAPNYQELGRTDLDGPELRRRLTTWTMALLA